jgi:hypothetical protein
MIPTMGWPAAWRAEAYSQQFSIMLANQPNGPFSVAGAMPGGEQGFAGRISTSRLLQD